MSAPQCDHCGRRDTSFVSLWVKAQRELRKHRFALKSLRGDLIVANALVAEEQARRLDAEARCRRSEGILDLLTRARCDEIAKGEGAS